MQDKLFQFKKGHFSHISGGVRNEMFHIFFGLTSSQIFFATFLTIRQMQKECVLFLDSSAPAIFKKYCNARPPDLN